MFDWMSDASQQLWRNGLVLIPLCLIVGAICRCFPCRPATRHVLWLSVLAASVVLPFLPQPPVQDMTRAAGGAWDRSKQVAGVAATLWSELSADAAEHEANRDDGDPTPSLYIVDATLASPLTSMTDLDDCECEWTDVENLAPFSSWIASGGEPADIDDLVEDFPLEPIEPIESMDPVWWWSAAADDESELEPIPAAIAATQDPEFPSQTQNRDGPATALSGERDVAPAPIPVTENAITEIPPSSDAAPSVPTWRRWLLGLAAVRDAVGRLPVLPAPIWIGGIVLLAIAHLIATLRFHYRVRTSSSAPAATRRLVLDVAASMDLSTAPETHFVDAHVSPLVWRPWMSERPRLVLPRPLWEQLDARGRRAIVCHELAHLKRLDHWVHWAQMLVGLVYWWHPLVWWVRRHVAEEAEHSCDAWVTWLMPGGRRAYAEALLRTKQFVSERTVVAPVGGVGNGLRSDPTIREERITMVMTDNKRPGRSTTGIMLAAALALTGWITMPAWSCPPEEKASKAPKAIVVGSGVACDDNTFAAHMKSKQGKAPCGGVAVSPCGSTAVVTAPTAPSVGTPIVVGPKVLGVPGVGIAAPSVAPRVVSGVSAGLVSAPVAPGSRILSTTPLAVMGMGGDDDEKLEERIENLEESLEEIREMLREMSGQRQGRSSANRRTRQNREPRAPRAPAPPRAQSRGRGGSSETIRRAYKLPEGKLEALTALMVRDDVPVLVSPGDEAITVIGTEKQHKAFKAFVSIIHPSKDGPDHGDAHDHDHGKAHKRFKETERRYAEALRAYELEQADRVSAVEALRSVEQGRRAQADVRRAIEAYRAQAAAAAETAKARELQIRELKLKSRELNRRQSELRKILKELQRVEDAESKDKDRRRSELNAEERALEDQAYAVATERDRMTDEVQLLLQEAKSLMAEAEAMEASEAGVGPLIESVCSGTTRLKPGIA